MILNDIVGEGCARINEFTAEEAELEKSIILHVSARPFVVPAISILFQQMARALKVRALMLLTAGFVASV